MRRRPLRERLTVTVGMLGVIATVSWAGAAAPASALPPTTTYATPVAPFGDCSTAAQACSLNLAVADAGDHGTVMLATGTYADTQLAPVGALSLTAEPGATPILDGGGLATVLTANSGSMTLTGVTVKNTGEDGIDCNFGALDLENSVVDEVGGFGIFAASQCGSITVNNSTIAAETQDVGDSFGVVQLGSALLTVTGSSITATSDGASDGSTAYGVIDDFGGTMSVANSTISAVTTSSGSEDVAYGVFDFGTPLGVTGSALNATVNGSGPSGLAYGVWYDDGANATLSSTTATAGVSGTGSTATDEAAVAIQGGEDAGTLSVATSQFRLSGTNSVNSCVKGIANGSDPTSGPVADCLNGSDKVDNDPGAVVVDQSQFTENYTAAALTDGGGQIVGIDTGSPLDDGLTVSSSSFTMSSPAGATSPSSPDLRGSFGGGIFGIVTTDGSATVSDSTFSGSTASLAGSIEGIQANNPDGLTVNDSNLSASAAAVDPKDFTDDPVDYVNPCGEASEDGIDTVGEYANSCVEDVEADGPATLNDDSLGVAVHPSASPNFNFGLGVVAYAPVQVNQSTVATTADFTGAAPPVLPADGAAIVSAGGTVDVQDSTVTTTGSAIGIDADSPLGNGAAAQVNVEDSTVGGVSDHTTGVATDAFESLLEAVNGDATVGSATLIIEQSTIARNGTAGIARLGSGTQTVTLNSDIVAGNGHDCGTGANPLPAAADKGYNIDSDATCVFTKPSSVNASLTLTSTLATLADNGGPTQTMGLLTGSPALNLVAGNQLLNGGATACQVPDQRGVNRPGFTSAGAPCDAGAVNALVPPASGGGGGGGIGAESLALGSSPPSSVFGQPAAFTAILTPAPGCGTVLWTVDGVAQGSGVPVSGGTVSGGGVTVTLGSLSNLAVGSHTIAASFAGCPGFGAASGSTTQVVGKAATTTAVTTSATSLTATVTPTAPGAGTPTGSVAFSVDGTSVGSGTVGAGGVATLTYSLSSAPPAPSGTGHVVSATYAGDASFTGSSKSTTTSGASLTNPTILAQVTSAHPKTAAGWYRSAVTVTFTCTVGSAPLNVAGCPAPVTLGSDGAAQSVTGTVMATDGGTASVTVSPINIDTTPPTGVKVHGATNGATYSYAKRVHHLTCTANDSLSGVAACTVSKHTTTTKHYKVVHYSAKATNLAGGTTTATGVYRYHRKG